MRGKQTNPINFIKVKIIFKRERATSLQLFSFCCWLLTVSKSSHYITWFIRELTIIIRDVYFSVHLVYSRTYTTIVRFVRVHMVRHVLSILLYRCGKYFPPMFTAINVIWVLINRAPHYCTVMPRFPSEIEEWQALFSDRLSLKYVKIMVFCPRTNSFFRIGLLILYSGNRDYVWCVIAYLSSICVHLWLGRS